MLVIGLDVGTTGTKAVIADEKGKILAGAYKEYELISEVLLKGVEFLGY